MAHSKQNQQGGSIAFQQALEAVEQTSAEQAKLIEKAFDEGRISVQDILGFVKTLRAIQ